MTLVGPHYGGEDSQRPLDHLRFGGLEFLLQEPPLLENLPQFVAPGVETDRFRPGLVLPKLSDALERERAQPTVEMALDLVETTRFGRWGRSLPADVIRGVLAAKTDGTNHLFLRLAVDDDADDKKLARSWDRAIQAIVDCSQYDSWGSKTRRTRTRKLAKNARLLQAIQGTVAHIDDPSDDMLSVLVTDGSAASIDASAICAIAADTSACASSSRPPAAAASGSGDHGFRVRSQSTSAFFSNERMRAAPASRQQAAK